MDGYRNTILAHGANRFTKVFGYSRLSSPGQAGDDHFSLAVQKQAERKFAEDLGYNDIVLIDDVCSAFKGKIPRNLFKLLNEAPRGSIIVCYSFDRVSRNSENFGKIYEIVKEKNLILLSLTEYKDILTPVGKNEAFALVASAEYTSSITSNKVKASVRYRKSIGSHVGGCVFGYTTVRKIKPTGEIIRVMVPDVKQQMVVKIIIGLVDGVVNSTLNGYLRQVSEFKGPFEPLNFYTSDGSNKITSIKPKQLTFVQIARILNDYCVPLKGTRVWSGANVSAIYHRAKDAEVDLSSVNLEELKDAPYVPVQGYNFAPLPTGAAAYPVALSDPVSILTHRHGTYPVAAPAPVVPMVAPAPIIPTGPPVVAPLVQAATNFWKNIFSS